MHLSCDQTQNHMQVGPPTQSRCLGIQHDRRGHTYHALSTHLMSVRRLTTYNRAADGSNQHKERRRSCSFWPITTSFSRASSLQAATGRTFELWLAREEEIPTRAARARWAGGWSNGWRRRRRRFWRSSLRCSWRRWCCLRCRWTSIRSGLGGGLERGWE
eukprot:3174795-Pleurochrysis_carterae.AAC.1